MTTRHGPRVITDLRELAEKIRIARASDKELGKVVFLIGAGCSISAGIPGAADIAKRMVREVAQRFGYRYPKADSVAAYKSIVENKSFDSCLKGGSDSDATDETIDWYRVCDAMFRRHYIDRCPAGGG